MNRIERSNFIMSALAHDRSDKSKAQCNLIRKMETNALLPRCKRNVDLPDNTTDTPLIIKEIFGSGILKGICRKGKIGSISIPPISRK